MDARDKPGFGMFGDRSNTPRKWGNGPPFTCTTSKDEAMSKSSAATDHQMD